ncbi:MAG: pyridoxal phosphate-dependent aminotransferase [Nannocystis sp.]|nr:pyridoxal phosphate-dependent aminotransferase [Nannocystis sp.]
MSARSTSELEINARAQAIRPSATLAVAARAKALRLEGRRVLDFSTGEPDFKPPAAVTATVSEFLRTRPVHYPPVAGLTELREEVALQLGAVHGRAFSSAEVMVSAGAKHALANLFMVTLSPGDEVVILAPYWVSYPDMVRLAGGVPRVATARIEDRWQIRPEALAAVLGPRTRFVVINSPSNPTGAVLSGAEIQAIVALIEELAPSAWLILDDIYRRLVYGDAKHVSAFRALGDRFDRIVAVDGVSKSYAMTGYRIGFLLAPAPVIAAASRIQGQMTSGVAMPSQVAALAALRDPAGEEVLATMLGAFGRRRRLVIEEIGAIESVGFLPPDGAFYAFFDVRRHLGPGTPFADDLALATWLLERESVALVPGTPFGAPGHLRLSYATADEDLREGLSRLRAAFAALPVAG